MIRPNITPGRVVGSAAAGMFSAAKSSVRRVDKMTETISRAPDVTKDQKFGINYVGFFGSKKNTKILKKSLKSIRDSLVATFGIAKLLRSEVSKNAKVIGEKVKGKKGLFGIGLGGVIGLIGLLTNPIILSILGIVGGVAAGGFLIKLLYDNRDKIIGFIMDKARGLYDFFQQMVSNIVRGVFADRAKTPELRNVESLSEERIDKSIKDIMEGKDSEFTNFEGTEGEARILATKREIEFLKSEQQKLDLSTNPRTSKANKPGDLIKFDNYEARIKELETGEVTTDKLKGFSEFLFGDQIRGTIEREAVFLPPAVNYSGMSQQEKLKLLEMVYRKFQQEGNDPNRIIEVYQRALDQGNLSDDQQAQARDLIDYYKKMNKVERDNTKESKVDDKIVPSSTDKNIKNLSSNFEGTSGKESGTGLGGGVNPKVAAAGGGPDLVQNPVPAKTAPEMVVHINFDPDNQYRDVNASLLNIFV